MTTVSVSNTANPKQPPVPARKPDGTPYRWELLNHSQQARYYAETLPELIGAAMDASLPVTLDDRLAHARMVAAVSNNFALREATSKGETLTEEERSILLGGQPVGDAWESTVPLTLLSTDFKPHTETFRPFSIDGDVLEPSNIVWLYPENDESYVLSLADAGWIRLNRHMSHTA